MQRWLDQSPITLLLSFLYFSQFFFQLSANFLAENIFLAITKHELVNTLIHSFLSAILHSYACFSKQIWHRPNPIWSQNQVAPAPVFHEISEFWEPCASQNGRYLSDEKLESTSVFFRADIFLCATRWEKFQDFGKPQKKALGFSQFSKSKNVKVLEETWTT